MQNTNFKKLLDLMVKNISPIISDSWSKRSLLFLSLLFGFYFTNSLLSFLLDKPVNTIFLAFLIVIFTEIFISLLILPKSSKFTIFLHSANNFRIGSTYALILEAFKLGS